MGDVQTGQTFVDLLQNRWKLDKYVCIGLDVDINKLPRALKRESKNEDRAHKFNRAIIDATNDYASAYKFNSAHYERLGEAGLRALRSSIRYIKDTYPTVPVILDAKRGDIRETNEYYARAIFDELKVDAVTVHPYIGRMSLMPFLSRKDKGVIVMGANTAEGSEEIQSLRIHPSGEPLYRVVCRHVAETWNNNGNCAVTAGSTNVEQLRDIRMTVGEMPILLPGIGAQGGDIKKSIKFGRAKNTFGLIVSSSRAIIYASNLSDFDKAAGRAARVLNEDIISIKQSLD